MTLVGRHSELGSTAPSIRVSVRYEVGATVVSLEGVAATDTPDAVIGPAIPLTHGTTLVVVNLDGLTLLDRDVVRRLLNRVQAMLAASGGKVRVVCRRSTARNLLRAWRVNERFPVFPTLAAAIA